MGKRSIMRKELKFAVWVWVFLVVYSKDAHVGATTDPNDIKALMQLKADIDAATIDSTSCLGTWDFSIDPCESIPGAILLWDRLYRL